MTYTTTTSTISYDIIRENLLHSHTPLLLLHSALGTRREFNKLTAYYEDRSIILLDFPSHGDSTTALERLTIHDLAESVHSLLVEELHIPVVDVIGYSMGGYVAIELALMAPAVVRSIISHAMKFYWTPEAIADAIQGLDPITIKARSQKGYDALSMLHQTNGFERTALLAASIIESFRARQLSVGDIARLQCPLLLSVGDRDEMVPPEEVSKLYLELPKTTTYLAIHPTSPHQFAKLDLNSFTTAIREFWKSLS